MADVILGADTFVNDSGDDYALDTHAPTGPNAATAWVEHTSLTGVAKVNVATDDVQYSSGSGRGVYYISDTPPSSSQYAEVDITVGSASSTGGAGVALRYASSGTNTGYWTRINPASNVIQLYRNVAGSATLIDTISNSLDTAASFRFRLEVEDVGGNPTFRAFVDGSPQTWVTSGTTTTADTSGSKITATNNIGLSIQFNDANGTLDNFECGTFSSAPNITSIGGDDALDDAETTVVVTGTGFVDGNGTFTVAATDNVSDGNATNPTVSSGNDTQLTLASVDLSGAGIAAGGTGYAFYTTSGNLTNASGFAFTRNAAGNIALSNEPADFTVFQRNASDTYSLALNGTYGGAGTPTTIQYRVVQHGTDTAVTGHDWQTLDASPSAGTFSGTITGIPADNQWYNVDVRWSNETGVTDEGANRWAVGMLVGVIGQSNARRMFEDGTDYTAAETVAQYSGTWATPAANGARKLGDIIAATHGVAVGMLKYGVGSTALVADADTGSGDWSTYASAPYSTFDSAVTALGGALEFIIWSQGETDANREYNGGSAMTVSEYKTALGALLDQLELDITPAHGLSELPFFIAQTGRDLRASRNDDGYAAVHQAQREFCAERSNAYLGAVCIDLPLAADDIHYTAAGFTTLGERLGNAILAYLGESAVWPSPTISHAEAADSGNTTVTITHADGSDFTPAGAGNVTGFTVLDDATPVGNVSASRASATTISISHDAVTGNLAVRYLWGRQPTITGAVKDNTSLALPLVPQESISLILPPTITSIGGDDVLVDGETSVVVVGTDFIDGSGTFTIAATDSVEDGNATTPTVSSGNDTQLTLASVDLAGAGIAEGATGYAFYTSSGNVTNASGFQFTRADETAPVLTDNLAVASPTATGGNLTVTTDEGNGTLFWVVTADGETPSATEIQAGQTQGGGAAADSGNITVSGTGSQALGAASGLTESTVYDIHAVHVDAASNVSNVVRGTFTTATAPDETAPTLSSPSTANLTDVSVIPRVVTDEANGTLYMVVVPDGDAPSITQIKAGQQSDGSAALDSGNQTVTATGLQSMATVTGLTAETAYELFFVHRDAAGNDSDAATVGFTTEADGFSLGGSRPGGGMAGMGRMMTR